jgi:ATPase subunit of ABC transporter with duplicated ATPase domains
LLFSDVSFRASSGEHVGLVGSNGVGKSTLFRVLTGELQADEGDVSVGVVVGYMAQDVGAADDSRSVRELLLSLAPLAVRRAGERVLRSERDILGAKHGVVGLTESLRLEYRGSGLAFTVVQPAEVETAFGRD